MNEKPPYRKWVGVLLGFLLTGSAHFLSGKRSAGLKWFFGLFVCGLVGVASLGSAGTVPYILGVALGFTSLALWSVMLKQSYRPVRRIGFLGWLAVIALTVVLSNAQTILLGQFVKPFKVPTGTMSPTILPGDHLFVERLSYRFGKPKRGDIVIFRTEGVGALKPKFYIRRVAGIPGERIRIEPPFLIVNDQKVTEPEIFLTIANKSDGYSGFQLADQMGSFGGFVTQPTSEVLLGPIDYFVLGDNTEHSLDSRHFGAVAEKSIFGKATRIYWPFNRSDQSLGKE